ncbi:MAG TPA: glycosyltransferase family 2 protein [Nitrospiria bacterium]|nr:glycosyltransferase family 2 protein [Nitrospiria bacterium]
MTEPVRRARVSLVIPVHNEAMNITDLVKRTRDVLGPEDEVLVVDDGSTDGSGQLARDAGARVVSHPYRMGNGAAIKSGIRSARGSVVVMMDGDGQHNPADVPRLVAQIGPYDMAVGARAAGSQSDMHRWLGNRFYNVFASYLTNRPILDTTSGFRAIKASLARRFVYLLPNAFSYPTTLTMATIRAGHSVTFVPIVTARRKGESKLQPLRDGARFLVIMFKIATLYSPIKVFLPVSAAFFATGLGYYLYTFIESRRFTNMSALLFINAVIIFLMGLVSEQIAQMRFEHSERLTDHDHSDS